MSLVFKHAQRHELIPASIDADGRPTNPALLCRVKSESDYEAVVVSPEQMIEILAELNTPDTFERENHSRQEQEKYDTGCYAPSFSTGSPAMAA